MTRREIDRRFNLSKPSGVDANEACDAIRSAIKWAACEVIENTPSNREQATALPSSAT